VVKIRAAVEARRSDDFVIIGRTDSRALNGLDDAIERGQRYAEAGADIIFVVHPLVPSEPDGDGDTAQARGIYTIMEQAGRIYSQNLLQLGLSTLRIKHPHTEFHLIQPTRDETPLFGPSMGFEASRAALRYGYESTKEWLSDQGLPLLRRLQAAPQAV